MSTFRLGRACVVGGGGFLGGHITHELVSRGFQVSVLDLTDESLGDSPYRFIAGSINDPDALDEALAGSTIVYNCAAIADLQSAQQDPVATLEVNLIGTIQLLKRSIQLGVTRFNFASSVYAASRHGGFYRISKQAAEAAVEELCRESNTDYTILRYGSLYGPGSPRWNGLRRIVESAVRDGCLEYHGSAEAVREYIHVADAGRLSVDVLSSHFANKTVTITGVETFRVADVMTSLAEILDIDSVPVFHGIQDRDQYVRTPYSFEKQRASKVIPSHHIDLAQGLLELVSEISAEFPQATKAVEL